MREYANDVVYTLGAVCRNEDLPMPHLISESGRALTAQDEPPSAAPVVATPAAGPGAAPGGFRVRIPLRDIKR